MIDMSACLGPPAAIDVPTDDIDEYAGLSRRAKRTVARMWESLEAPERSGAAESVAAEQALALVETWQDFGTVDDLDAAAVLAEMQDAQRAVNLAQAKQLALAAQWADLHGVVQNPPGERGSEKLLRPGGSGTPEVAEFCRAELGAALGVSQTTAGLLIGDAIDLRHRLPRLWRQVQTGDVKIFVARAIARKTRHLSVRAAAKVDAMVARLAATLPFGRLDKALDAAILRADPAQAAIDTAAAANGQGVWVARDAHHGYGTIFGKAAAPDLKAVDKTLDTMARALTVLGDTDSHDVRRAKALGLLADPTAALELARLAQEAVATADAAGGAVVGVGPHDGSDPRRGCDLGTAVLYVHVTEQTLPDAVSGLVTGAEDDGVARVDGIRPILMHQLRSWLGHRQVRLTRVIDLPGMPAVDRYEVPDSMAAAIRLRTPADCAPYSPNLSGIGDNDHTTPYRPPDDGGPPGQTAVDNLGWLGRGNHRWKTHGGWRVTQPRSGMWIWRSPHGYYFLVDGAGTTPLGMLTESPGRTAGRRVA